MDSFDAARAFTANLRRTQWLEPGDMTALQAPLIERLCRHAALETDFYAERLKVLFENGDVRTGKFRFENWTKIPIFGRAEAQEANDQLHARATPEVLGPYKTMHTSGSTGRPLEFRRSALTDVAGLARTDLGFEMHDFDPSGRMGWILFVEDKSGWIEQERRGWTLRNPQSELFCLSKAVSMTHCVEWLRRVKPRYLMVQPSIVAGIIAEIRGEGGPAIDLDAIWVTSEAASETLAEDVREVFGARLVDNYGGREVGEIAITCPDHGPAKHVSAETMLVELITPEGTAARPGELARVVVTPFYGYATPLIRYDLGDFAIQGEASCACGRGAPLIERVLGRQHALFRFKDGSTRFPVGLDAIKKHLCARQMQIVQTELMRIEVRYAPDPKGASPDFKKAEGMVRHALHADVDVDFVIVERIEQNRGGKFEDLISLVAASETRVA